MKKIIVLLLCLCMATAFVACDEGSGTSTADSAATHDSSAVNVIDPNENVFVIHTDYCDMKYPSKWEKEVKVDVSAEKVSFTTADGKAKLFDLCFGGNEGYIYGTLTGENPVEIRVVSYDIDAKQEEFDDYCAMQEDMNVILQYLIDEGKLKAD